MGFFKDLGKSMAKNVGDGFKEISQTRKEAVSYSDSALRSQIRNSRSSYREAALKAEQERRRNNNM